MSRPAHAHPRYALVALVCAAVLAIGLAVPAPALAFSADVWESISVMLTDLDVNKEPGIVIAAALKEGTELPAEVAISIPKGSTIVWAGELTGDFSSDPVVEIAGIDEGEDYDLVRFTMVQTPYAQLELSVPEGIITRTPEGRRIDFAWVAAGDATRARIGVASPLDLRMESVVPSASVEVRPTDVFYTVEMVPAEAGGRMQIAGVLVVGQAPELAAMVGSDDATATGDPGDLPGAEVTPGSAVPASGGGVDPTTVLLGILVAALVVVAFLLVRNLRSGALPPEE